MNFNIKIFLLCPIPEDQKPINEYIGLKENRFTNWITLPTKEYYSTIVRLFATLFLICLTFNVEGNDSIQEIILTCVKTTIWSLTSLVLTLLYIVFNWKQIDLRFNTSRLIYEEGSWYTSEIWEKPISLIKNDKLISTQILQLVLIRNIKVMSILFFLIFILFFFAEIF
jgi:hypothetical protein